MSEGEAREVQAARSLAREREELHHLDLYRLSRGADAELFAWDDYLGPRALTFVEWPAAGSGALPAADVRLELEHRTPRSRLARVFGPGDVETAVAAGCTAVGIVPVAATDAAGGHPPGEAPS